MAKQYFAVNRIIHGMGGGEEKVFEAGQQVTGLDKDTMVTLWEAGVLTEVDPDNRPEDDRDVRIRELEAQLEAARADKAAAEAAANEPSPADREPAEIPGMGPAATANTTEAARDMEGTIHNPLPDDKSKDTDKTAASTEE